MVDMAKGAPRTTIFETVAGAHENRFVPFNSISHVNSKYEIQSCHPDYHMSQGREVPPEIYFKPKTPEPLEADYKPNHDFCMKPLVTGYVEFSKFAARKDVQLEYKPPQQFYETIEIEKKEMKQS